VVKTRFSSNGQDRVFLVTTAEDSPTPASGFDHQKGHIDFWLKFIGVKEVQTLVVEGTTWGGKEKGEEAIARGQEEAKKVAADF
jgi:FMN-dependent NADH-azoreductase